MIINAIANACVLPVQCVTAVENASNRAPSDDDVRWAMRRMIVVSDRPRIGVSACLLGKRARSDGRDKRAAWLVEILGPQVEWVAVCPEVEAGLGTPREPMNLGRDRNGRLALITDRVRDDLTKTMADYSERR